jgi:hypothetical protein
MQYIQGLRFCTVIIPYLTLLLLQEQPSLLNSHKLDRCQVSYLCVCVRACVRVRSRMCVGLRFGSRCEHLFS